MSEHTTIYRKPGRYAGWPANYGIWAWDDRIVVGFTVGYMRAGDQFHPRDTSRPFVAMQATSRDDGRTWETQPTPCADPWLSADEHMPDVLPPPPQRAAQLDALLCDCPGDVDFTQPGVALMCARTGLTAGARSSIYLSTDRCKSWQGPYRLPMFGQLGIAARTDYVVTGSRECTLMLTATKPDGGEGRVFCARTSDGGASFQFVSWIDEHPSGYAIMPSTVRLRDEHLLTAIRRQTGNRNWIDLFESRDNGATWRLITTPVADTGRGGNPPAMIQLRDRRLCLTFGYRDGPYAIRAVLSDDDGRTWSDTMTLRDGAANHDIGYTRTCQRADGTIVTAYYYNDAPNGERYIAATRWRAD